MTGELSFTPATLIANAMFGSAPLSVQDAMAVLEAALGALHDLAIESWH